MDLINLYLFFYSRKVFKLFFVTDISEYGFHLPGERELEAHIPGEKSSTVDILLVAPPSLVAESQIR